MDIAPPESDRQRRRLNRILFPHADPDQAGLDFTRVRCVGAWSADRPLGGVAWHTAADGSAVLCPPVIDDETVSEEQGKQSQAPLNAALLAAATAQAAAEDCHSAILLADPRDERLAEAAESAHFSHLTDAIALSRGIDPSANDPPKSPGAVVEYGPRTRHRFHAVFHRTQASGQDCPALTSRRTPESALAMFADAGTVAPGDWVIVRHRQQDAALLLLNEYWDATAIEIAYLGVVPEMRRRGFGRALVAVAIRRTRAGNFTRIVTNVDAMNQPARALYASTDFTEERRQRIFHRSLLPTG